MLVTATQDVERVHAKVRERYGKAAIRQEGCANDGCCAPVYSPAELATIPVEAVLNLGSGTPVRHADLRPGEVVVDLGSGGGVDVFLAANIVGPTGLAIGVDMTPEMVQRAEDAARARGIRNVRFLESPIEKLHIPSASADIVLSNCVINLSPDKPAVFAEAFRILRPGGRLAISDVVQERPLGEVDDECGCVATALVRADFLELIRRVGFENLRLVEDRPWRSGPGGVEASAVTLVANKPTEEVKP